MAFFGLEQNDLLEREKEKFLREGANGGEDLAVYTWGEESYDGLGDALQEGGDDLNDETFGGTGPVGKDFDFTAGGNLALEESNQPLKSNHSLRDSGFNDVNGAQRLKPGNGLATQSAASPQMHSGQSAWDDKSLFAGFGRLPGISRHASERSLPSTFSPFETAQPSHQSPTMDHAPPIRGPFAGQLTMEEVEAEMRLAAMRAREQAAQQQQSTAQQLLHRQTPPMQGPFSDPTQLLRHEIQQQQQTRTPPPPRMHPHSQSPRFHQQLQQQILINRQNEQHQLRDLQHQLQMEQLTRQMRQQELLSAPAPPQMSQGYLQDEYVRGPNIAELRAAQELQQMRRPSPAFDPHIQQLARQHGAGALPDIQMQQRLLHQAANDQFLRDMGRLEQVDQRSVNQQIHLHIMEAERMEEKRRRKAAKIAHMARYNDLMTQSDKDFITRIQVSQLVTQDPYTEDFYAQIYGAIMRSKLGLQSQDRVMNFGNAGGVALGVSQRPSGRRASAIQKMEAQVEKIVQAARVREKEKGVNSLNSLQGALGKTASRSYKAAPRQLLQVSEETPDEEGENAARKAAQMGHDALGSAGNYTGLRRDPLTLRESLSTLEKLYDILGRLEQRERERPPPEEEEAFKEWLAGGDELIEKMWNELQVSVPLEACNPHPFVSLLMPAKGKRFLPRLTKFLSSDRNILLLTLLVATFSQQDVVTRAPLLDSVEPSELRSEVERQTHTWLDSIPQAILGTITHASLLHISSWLGMLLERSNIIAVASTEPGLALLTLLMSRVDHVKRDLAAGTLKEQPSIEDGEQWQSMYNLLFQLLAPNILLLFPSVRINGSTAYNESLSSKIDARVWQFLAVFAVHTSNDQQAVLVTALRDKILSDVGAVKQGWIADVEEAKSRIANVDLFMHALGLDSSQIAF